MMRVAAGMVLAAMLIAGLLAAWIAPHGYAEQDRESPNVRPSAKYWLGTDELGRDRLSRLLYATRVSLLLAPAAALIAITIAAAAGIASACGGPWIHRMSAVSIDLLLSLPAILVLLTVRALLPLNVAAWTSILITCGLIGALSWPPAARVIGSGAGSLLDSDFVLLARAAGQSPVRILFRQMLPALWPVLLAQFWLMVPVFVMAEANLSLLGLGVAEPMPSWGNLLRELENYAAIPERPWVLAPLGVLVIAMLCLYELLPAGEEA